MRQRKGVTRLPGCEGDGVGDGCRRGREDDVEKVIDCCWKKKAHVGHDGERGGARGKVRGESDKCRWVRDGRKCN